ncbi:MAG: IPT/TIG domain-containing protein [Nitrospiraceae bacterium]
MRMPRHLTIALTIIVAVFLWGTIAPHHTSAAEQAKPRKEAKDKKAPQSGKSQSKSFASGSIKASGAAEVAKATACFGDVPKIEKVSPDEGKAGDKVTITGKNFGVQGCLTGVSFGPGHGAKFQQASDTEISATVPTGGRKGLAIVSVTTASGEDSKPFLVK